jgi:stage V sporulation protein S
MIRWCLFVLLRGIFTYFMVSFGQRWAFTVGEVFDRINGILILTMQIDNYASDLVTMNIIKVSAHSRTAAVAGAIAGVMRDTNHAEVQAIGAGAVNQAVKAIVIAKGYLAEEDVHIMCVPSFVEIEIDDQERTAIRFNIQPIIQPIT